MTFLKRVLSVLVIVSIFVLSVPFAASAAPDCTISLDAKQARPGDEVTLTLTASSLNGSEGLELHLYFDPAALEFVRGETTGVLKDMPLNDATLVAGTKNHICVTGGSLQTVNGGGVIAYLTFRVKDTAPDGSVAVTFDVAASGVLFDGKLAAVSMTDGGVSVDKNGETGLTVAPSETVQTSGITAGTTVITDESGKQVELPAVTVVDDFGTRVTLPNGQPRYEYQVPITVDKVSADPGEEVEVFVSALSATDVTMAAVNVEFDASALTLVSAQATAAYEKTLTVSHETYNGNDVVKIYYFGEAVDLNGRLAKLVFRVKDSAKKGDYRLSLGTSELRKENTVILPLSLNSGNVHVNKDGFGIFGSVWTYVVVAVVGAAVAVLIVVFVKKQKNAPKKPKKQHDVIRNVDEDI